MMTNITNDIRDAYRKGLKRIMNDCSDVEDDLFFMIRNRYIKIVDDISDIKPNGAW